MEDQYEVKETGENEITIEFKNLRARAVYRYDPERKSVRRIRLEHDSVHLNREAQQSSNPEKLFERELGYGKIANAKARAKQYFKEQKTRVRKAKVA